MENKLTDKVIAILATDGVEQSELTKPRGALESAGATTRLISLKEGQIKAWNEKNWGESFDVDATLEDVSVDDFDGLVLPGGVMNPDTLRVNKEAVAFVQEFYKKGKVIAAICHGPWLLIEADIVRDMKLTSWPSLKTDIQNAGGIWEDAEVIVDNGIVTSRNPDDIPAFNDKLIEELIEGDHSRD